jgi:hypothetical protein
MFNFLWNPKTHKIIQKLPSLDPFLSQFNPVYNIKSYFFKILFSYDCPIYA